MEYKKEESAVSNILLIIYTIIIATQQISPTNNWSTFISSNKINPNFRSSIKSENYSNRERTSSALVVELILGLGN
jgi:hypothetical protein